MIASLVDTIQGWKFFLRCIGFGAAVCSLAVATGAYAEDVPATDPELFEQMFRSKTISPDWIDPVAREELSAQMMTDIAERMTVNGGQYRGAKKAINGWRLSFKRGVAKARIVRSSDGRLIGVSFSAIE